jgi:acetolactate synthase-1/2/3 large subunit
VTDARQLPRVFREAFHLARTGRRGPVLIDVTKDAQQARVVPDWEMPMQLAGYRPAAAPDLRQIDAAAQLLRDARRPLIMAGNGVIWADAAPELLQLAEKTGIPVITTLHGKGAFPEQHPLSLGMPGMHGWVHVNKALQECDVLLNVGGRFDDRVTGRAATFAPHARIIHVDIDPSEIGRNVRVDVPVVSDAREALRALLDAVKCQTRPEWLAHIRCVQSEHQPRQAYMRRSRTDMLMPHDVYAALDRLFRERGGCRVVTDVGQHQMWAAQLIEWREPGAHITSGGSGTMGFSIPAALGAALACPGDVIWVICGDGGFQMTSQELATIQQEGIRNIKIAIINNGYLGMVRQWQQLFENRQYSGTRLSSPDFVTLATAYGIHAQVVERPEDVDRAVRSAWDHDGSVVLDFRVEREANVFPIVPQGKSIGEMITEA